MGFYVESSVAGTLLTLMTAKVEEGWLLAVYTVRPIEERTADGAGFNTFLRIGHTSLIVICIWVRVHRFLGAFMTYHIEHIGIWAGEANTLA